MTAVTKVPAASQDQAAQDAVEIAERGVDRWFNSVITSSRAHQHGSVFQFLLEETFEAVSEALHREHVADHGKIERTDHDTPRVLAMEAGYLVGVQVGLRIRVENRGRDCLVVWTNDGELSVAVADPH